MVHIFLASWWTLSIPKISVVILHTVYHMIDNHDVGLENLELDQLP